MRRQNILKNESIKDKYIKYVFSINLQQMGLKGVPKSLPWDIGPDLHSFFPSRCVSALKVNSCTPH